MRPIFIFAFLVLVCFLVGGKAEQQPDDEPADFLAQADEVHGDDGLGHQKEELSRPKRQFGFGRGFGYGRGFGGGFGRYGGFGGYGGYGGFGRYGYGFGGFRRGGFGFYG